MAKGYWVCFYRTMTNPDALAEYAKLAGPAIQGGGGKFLARGNPSAAYEAGKLQRTVVIEFESVERAKSTLESPAYQAACKLLQNSAERDIRIIEGLA
jgi:uncharacterized protein (DUF1330 family)